MGSTTSKEFQWSYTEEPHATRRKLIIDKHPEIKELFGPDPSLPWVVLAMVITQTIIAYCVKDSDWLLVFLQAYLVGAVMNHSLTLAIHEISHNLAYGNGRVFANRAIGMLGNFPIAVPYSISFKKYHLEHHRYMGEEVLDTDIPTELEGIFFNSTPRKFLWLLLQPFFYAFRPLIVYKKHPTDMEVLNVVIQLTYDYFIWRYMGGKSLFYLLFGTLIALGLHPTAGHFISEHYVFHPGHETNSYIGCLNYVMFNVGYHVEHHDFPYVSGAKLPLVRKIAPEFYADSPVHTSYLWVIWEFLTNPKMGPYARIKRAKRVEPNPYGHNMLAEYLYGVWYALEFLTYVGYDKLKSCMSSSSESGEGDSSKTSAPLAAANGGGRSPGNKKVK